MDSGVQWIGERNPHSIKIMSMLLWYFVSICHFGLFFGLQKKKKHFPISTLIFFSISRSTISSRVCTCWATPWAQPQQTQACRHAGLQARPRHARARAQPHGPHFTWSTEAFRAAYGGVRIPRSQGMIRRLRAILVHLRHDLAGFWANFMHLLMIEWPGDFRD